MEKKRLPVACRFAKRSISPLRLFALETIEIRRECGCANRALLKEAF